MDQDLNAFGFPTLNIPFLSSPTVGMSNFSMSHQSGFPPYYHSAASYTTSFVQNVPLNAGYSYPHPIVSTFSSADLHSQQFSSLVSGVMFNTGIASNSALQFLPSYVNPPPRYVSPPLAAGLHKLSFMAEMLTSTHKDVAVVFHNAQGRERVRCSVCWQYGGVRASRGGYFSSNGSGNLSLSGFQAHISSDFHVKSLEAKEKRKQPLETAVTGRNSDMGGASEDGSVTAVSLLQQLVHSMEKVSTSVEQIKEVLIEKL